MKIVRFILVPALMLTACKGGLKDTTATDESAEQRIQAVCISTGTPLREEPKKEGKWISSMLLGENLTYLGETVIDSANPQHEYYRVELSDGKLAWVRSYGILLNATPAAIISQTSIYKRPDLVTKTARSFNIVEFVAIVNEKEEWVEVTGAEKRKKGWIKRESVSTSKEDVAVATLAQKDLLDKEGVIVKENLSSFIENLPSGNSQLARYLQDQMANQVESAIEQSIQEYEGDEEDIVTEEQANESEY